MFDDPAHSQHNLGAERVGGGVEGGSKAGGKQRRMATIAYRWLGSQICASKP